MPTAAMFEQGWSSSFGRVANRFLARVLASRSLALPVDRAVASITFDDVPDSAADTGAPILERHGVRGTFYVAAEICGRQERHWRVASREQVRAIHEAGHEIGCHTAHHVNVQSLSERALEGECDQNLAAMHEICGPVSLTSFAYPFGDLGYRQRAVVERRFRSCRTIYEFFNTGHAQPGRIGAIGLFDAKRDRAGIARVIADAHARGGWLVFYTHDVAPTPTFMGTSPAFLSDTLAMLADAGIPVLTMREAMASF